MSGSAAVDDDLRRQKRELRRVMEARRRQARAQNPDAGRQLRDQFLKSIALPDHAVIACYIAHGSEPDPAPLAEALHAQGHALCLPAVVGKGAALVFRAYSPGDPLGPGALSIPEPAVTAAAAEPDVLLVPFLAFDRRLYRLGYGGGYYDRTLTNLRRRRVILAAGIGFGCLEAPEVPAGRGDAKLDKIVTELETF